MLPASIQVCPVEIPGRGRRQGDPAINDVKQLASMLAHSLPLSDKPYAIFGTCLGAIVGYEIVREVERSQCAPMPVALMPAAVSPPHLYALAVMRLYLQRKLRQGEAPPVEEVLATLRGWEGLDKATLLKAFEAGNFAGVEEMRRNGRLFQRVAPMGVNDIMMAVQYRWAAGASSMFAQNTPSLPRCPPALPSCHATTAACPVHTCVHTCITATAIHAPQHAPALQIRGAAPAGHPAHCL